MDYEIEKKFLLCSDAWRKVAGERLFLQQGYLALAENCTVRVRLIDADAGRSAFLTIKGTTHGISRAEFEYPIATQDAAFMLDHLVQKPVIKKYRYRILFQGFLWEIDEFLADNAGLVLAEIELQHADQQFPIPAWIGAEVSEDHSYANASLVKNPFCTWR